MVKNTLYINDGIGLFSEKYGSIEASFEPETMIYLNLPHPLLSGAVVDAYIKAIKAGNSVVLPLFIGNMSLVALTSFLTQCSVDMRAFVGFKTTINDGTHDLVGWIRSAGVAESLSGVELVGDPGFDSAAYWVIDAGTTVNNAGNSKCVFTAQAAGKGAVRNTVLPNTPGTLFKSTVTINSIASGSIKFYTGAIARPTGFTSAGTVSDYITMISSRYIGVVAGAANTTAQLDTLSTQAVIAPSGTGVVIWNLTNNSWVSGTATILPNAASYTVTISLT
jgi:hypothetical protein